MSLMVDTQIRVSHRRQGTEMLALNAFDVGAQIRQGRQANAWSQQDLADKIGVSRQWVVSIEKGAPTAQLHLVLEALRWVGYVCDMVPEADDGLLDQVTGGAATLHALLVTPATRTLRGGAAATSGRAALETAGADPSALEQRTTKGRRWRFDTSVAGVGKRSGQAPHG
jgi:DNA-binding XRE family transcriptional regulator